MTGNPSVAQAASVSLYLHGARLDPATVTALLGLSPTSSHTAGQARTSSGGVVRTKSGLWAVELQIDATEIAEAFEKLTTAIAASAHRLQSVPELEEGYFDIFVALPAEAAATDFTVNLRPGSIAVAAKAGLAVRLTVGVTGRID